jgi:hypothetical protein
VRAHRRARTTIPTSRWLAYAGAGAASALGLASSAEGEIHYSGQINALFPFGMQNLRTFPLDQPGDSVVFGRGSFGFPQITIYGLERPQGAVVGRSSSADALAKAVRSGRYLSSLNFAYGFYGYAELRDSHFYSPNYAPKFVGFRFRGGSGIQYGWMRVYGNSNTLDFKVIDYAWADPGEPIKTGQTSSTGDQVEAVPDQGSLGLLALGGAGLMTWRKRRAQATAPRSA